jgi:hypothetical protein
MPDAHTVGHGAPEGATRRQAVTVASAAVGGMLLGRAVAPPSAGAAAARPATGDVHLVGTTADGRLWHAIRSASGPWTSAGDIQGQAGQRGAFKHVACALAEVGLHVCGVTGDGRLWHTIRFPNGSWAQFGDVEGQAGDRGTFEAVSAIVTPNEDLHVTGITSDGRLWHTIRAANGGWTPFGDVEGQIGDRGQFQSVSLG